MNYLLAISLFALPAFAGEPKAAICRDKAVQIAAFVTVANDEKASLEKVEVELLEVTPGGEEEEDYGTEKWSVQFAQQPPVEITFRARGECFAQEISVAGL